MEPPRTGAVYCWGSLEKDGGDDELPTPFLPARDGLPLRVHAGSRSSAVVLEPKHVRWVDHDAGASADFSKAEQVAFGNTHSLALVRTGSGADPLTEVFAWGEGPHGQLGLGGKFVASPQPRLVLGLKGHRVVQIACGSAHSAAVTSYGDLFTWGRGVEGQLGHASRHLPKELNEAASGVRMVPKAVPAFVATKSQSRPVASVACGHSFTVVVTCSGEIWAFGEGGAGQLGLGRVTKVVVPTRVLKQCPKTGDGFVEAVAGWAHTMTRASGGVVHVWGFNYFGQLGLGDSKTRHTPHALFRDDGCELLRAIKLGASGNCSGALTLDGRELLTWGSADKGRLGHGAGIEQVHIPRPVAAFAGKLVADFDLCQRGGLAVVRTRVFSISPTSGPLSGGCQVTVRGCGFWDSQDIVVRFKHAGANSRARARAAVGTYRGEGGSGGGGGELITCTTPCFATAGPALMELSINGRDFASDGIEFRTYQDPTVAGVAPSVCKPPAAAAHNVLVRVDGEDLGSTGSAVWVRFTEDAANPMACGGERVYTVPGTVETEHVVVGEDEETGEELTEPNNFISCPAPLVEGPLPFLARVSVSLNGHTFTASPHAFTVHDPRPDSCRPAALCADTGARLCVSGQSLYVPAEATARVRYGPGDGDVAWLEELEVEPPGPPLGSLRALLPPKPELVKNKPACQALVELSVDGEEFLAVPDPVTLYARGEFTLDVPFWLAAGAGGGGGGGGGCPDPGEGVHRSQAHLLRVEPKRPVFRSPYAQARLWSRKLGVSVMTIPLLLEQPPHTPVEGGAEGDMSRDGTGAQVSTGGEEAEAPDDATGIGGDAGAEGGGGESDTAGARPWEQEVAFSQEPFYLVVPPLPPAALAVQGRADKGKQANEKLPAAVPAGGGGVGGQGSEAAEAAEAVEASDGEAGGGVGAAEGEGEGQGGGGREGEGGAEGRRGDGGGGEQQPAADRGGERKGGANLGQAADEELPEEPDQEEESIPTNRTLWLQTSLEGTLWGPTPPLRLTYYQPPELSALEPEAVTLSGTPTVTVRGARLFPSGHIVVRLLPPAAGSAEGGEVVDVPAAAEREAAPAADSEGEEGSGGVSWAVTFSAPEVLPASFGAHPPAVGVEVSLNGGRDFTSSGLTLKLKKK